MRRRFARWEMPDLSDGEQKLRADMIRWGRSLSERGYTLGSSGNISVRPEDGFLSTPTNSCLGFLDPERPSRMDAEGRRGLQPMRPRLPILKTRFASGDHASILCKSRLSLA